MDSSVQFHNLVACVEATTIHFSNIQEIYQSCT